MREPVEEFGREPSVLDWLNLSGDYDFLSGWGFFGRLAQTFFPLKSIRNEI